MREGIEWPASLMGLIEIASHEAIVPYPYLDSVRVWTWGIGHTHFAGAPYPEKMPKGVASSLEDVFEQFKKDMERFAQGVNRAIKVPVSQHEWDAALSFHFNTGGIGRAKWVKSLNRGHRRTAARQIMNWTRPREIIGRRRKEQSLFRDGTYTSGGWATVYKANKSGRVLWRTGKRVNLLDQFEDLKQIEKGGGVVTHFRPILVTLRPGSVGDEVRRLQAKLGILADGDFGPITRAAVIDFQRFSNLAPDGIAGPLTLTALGLRK